MIKDVFISYSFYRNEVLIGTVLNKIKRLSVIRQKGKSQKGG